MKKKYSIPIGILFLICLYVVLPHIQRPGKGFTDIIKKSGVTTTPSYGGVSWTDYDNDGYQDLLIKGVSGFILYHNNHDNTFTETTKEAGLPKRGHAIGAVFGDYDNDGCPDLYIINGFSESGGFPDSLYHNDCKGTFTDVTNKSGINAYHHARGIAWGDYDNDGYLDIYVSTFGVLKFIKTETSWTLTGWDFEPNVLYHNNGNGTFTDVTKKAKVGGLAKCIKSDMPAQYTTLKDNWQPVWLDYNNDGLQDIYVSHETTINTLYKNNGDGTFTDATEKAGLCTSHSTHGVAVGDYDNNGYLDIYAAGSRRSLLWKNNGNGTFTESALVTGTASIGFLAWDPSFFDYDNDGYLDLYSINGSTGHASFKNDYPNKLDALFKNDGHGKFVDVAKESGLYGNDAKTFGAFADFNNDGFTDGFIFSDVDKNRPLGNNRLYKNIPNGNHWLTIKLTGTKSNKSGIGAMLTVETKNGKQIRQVIAGDSLIGQNSLWPTFGLGGNTSVDTLSIHWPSGTNQTLNNVKANQILSITEPK